jgi:hypothetical protein
MKGEPRRPRPLHSVWPPPHRGRPVTCRVAPAASGPSLQHSEYRDDIALHLSPVLRLTAALHRIG